MNEVVVVVVVVVVKFPSASSYVSMVERWDGASLEEREGAWDEGWESRWKLICLPGAQSSVVTTKDIAAILKLTSGLPSNGSV